MQRGRNCSRTIESSQCNNATTLDYVYALDFASNINKSSKVNFTHQAGSGSHTGAALFEINDHLIDIIDLIGSPIPNGAVSSEIAKTYSNLGSSIGIGRFPIKQFRYSISISIWARLNAVTSGGKMLYSIGSPTNGLLNYLVFDPDFAKQSYTWKFIYSLTPTGDHTSAYTFSNVVANKQAQINKWTMYTVC
jgi:hypothetical protein